MGATKRTCIQARNWITKNVKSEHLQRTIKVYIRRKDRPPTRYQIQVPNKANSFEHEIPMCGQT